MMHTRSAEDGEDKTRQRGPWWSASVRPPGLGGETKNTFTGLQALPWLIAASSGDRKSSLSFLHASKTILNGAFSSSEEKNSLPKVQSNQAVFTGELALDRGLKGLEKSVWWDETITRGPQRE